MITAALLRRSLRTNVYLPARMAMCRLADWTALLTLLFSISDRARRVRRMVHRRHNDITIQNNAVSVPRFIETVIHATNVQRHLLPRNRQYNKPYIPDVHTFWV